MKNVRPLSASNTKRENRMLSSTIDRLMTSLANFCQFSEFTCALGCFYSIWEK